MKHSDDDPIVIAIRNVANAILSTKQLTQDEQMSLDRLLVRSQNITRKLEALDRKTPPTVKKTT